MNKLAEKHGFLAIVSFLKRYYELTTSDYGGKYAEVLNN